MIAIDTNILARYYLNDDPDQARLAQDLIERYAIHVPKTVILELEWVLRGVAKIDRASIARCLNHLFGLPNADIEQRGEIMQAFAHYQAGLDFADALHLAASQKSQAFMTFDDKRFARRAQRLNSLPPVRVLSREELEGMVG